MVLAKRCCPLYTTADSRRRHLRASRLASHPRSFLKRRLCCAFANTIDTPIKLLLPFGKTTAHWCELCAYAGTAGRSCSLSVCSYASKSFSCQVRDKCKFCRSVQLWNEDPHRKSRDIFAFLLHRNRRSSVTVRSTGERRSCKHSHSCWRVRACRRRGPATTFLPAELAHSAIDVRSFAAAQDGLLLGIPRLVAGTHPVIGLCTGAGAASGALWYLSRRYAANQRPRHYRLLSRALDCAVGAVAACGACTQSFVHCCFGAGTLASLRLSAEGRKERAPSSRA